MCQINTVTVAASPLSVECKACAMIVAKSRGRRPKHAEGCGHIPTFMERQDKLPKKLRADIIKAGKAYRKHQEEIKKTRKELHRDLKKVMKGKKVKKTTKVEKQAKALGLNKVLQKEIVKAAKDMNKTKKVNMQIKKKVHKDLNARLKELKKMKTLKKSIHRDLKKKVKDMKKQNKKTKEVKNVDMGCQTDFEFIHKCMRSRCNEVQVCQ